jgi:hypothetical protein
MQTVLVLITFTLAAGYLLKKFVWNPIFEGRRPASRTLDGGKTKCGDSNCGCH